MFRDAKEDIFEQYFVLKFVAQDFNVFFFVNKD